MARPVQGEVSGSGALAETIDREHDRGHPYLERHRPCDSPGAGNPCSHPSVCIRGRKITVTRFERWAVWSTSVATFVTGVIYLWMKYLVVSDDPLAVVNHPWQPAVLKVHILVAPLLVFSIGLVALRHVWWHFRSKARDGRRSGLLTLVVLGPMIVSGYLIQTMTEEGWLKAMAIVHI